MTNHDISRTVKYGRGTHVLFLIAALLLIGAATTLQAQPNLNFKRVTVNWPTVELYFSVGCNGNPDYSMTKQDFKIFENGVEVPDFTLWCPDPTVRCAISVSLVFDASGSMAGAGNDGAKQAGHAFVNLMDGVVDEASIIWFNEVATVAQQMTTVKPMLHSAVDALPAAGFTAVWDGIYTGIIELINNGVNQCRAVIVMTDGGDSQSSRTVAEVISLANRHRIRVFTIGLGTGINATELQLIALLTGGKYYQTPNAGQMSAIYQEITTIIFQGFQECMITYERQCADGGIRTVELQLKNFCGGTDVKTKTYRAPLDSTTFSNLNLELGDAQGRGGTEITVPLNLVSPLNNEMLYPFSFTLLSDSLCAQLKSVQTPPGSLLQGVPLTVTPVPGGVRIATMDRKLLAGSGMLLEFVFTASDPLDTTCCDVSAGNAAFEQGCFIPVIASGEICIIPRAPIVTCDMDAPKELRWQRGITDYTPNPFPVRMRVFNTGDREATNVRYRIIYNAGDVRLASPLTDVQNGVPANLNPGEFAEAIWQVAAKRRTSGDSLRFCIVASFDNHPDISCCVQTYVPPADPILQCEIDAPVVIADNANARYVPMPFPLTVTVTNAGGMQTDSVFATIIVPSELKLITGESSTKRLLPSLLHPNQQGQAQWMLQHAPTTVEKSYQVRIWVKSANADSSFCEKTIVIPPLNSPNLELRCYGPDTLRFDPQTGAWTPDPFPIRVSLVNATPDTLSSVNVTPLLPPGFVLDIGETGKKYVTPNPLLPGDTSLTLTWLARLGKIICRDTTVFISVQANGNLANGQPMPPVSCGFSLVVLAPAPQKATIAVQGGTAFCDGDSVVLDAGSGYIDYLWSDGQQTQSIVVRRSGAYFCEMTVPPGCPVITDTISVTVHPLPATPVITRQLDRLTATDADTWQWYRDGMEIPGATSRDLAASQTGSYRVRVTNSFGCEAWSDPFDVTVLDVADAAAVVDRFELFPNPTSGVVTLRYTLAAAGQPVVSVHDLLGRELLRRALPTATREGELRLDLSGLPTGFYHVRLLAGSTNITRQLLLSGTVH
ncbi:MAG: VWA domain-containing protein [Bacteroidetes bacterium]|nr:VWA domain-containing protein [Bacteroidota bacterium]